MSGIIDVSSTVPTKDFLYGDMLNMPEISMGYLRIFTPADLRANGFNTKKMLEMLHSMTEDDLVGFLTQHMEGFPRDLDEFVAALDAAGVRMSALHNFDEQAATGSEPVPNDKVAEIVGKYPDRFIGFAGVEPHKGQAAVREIDRCINELGLKAVALRPFMHDIYANDPKYFPIYARCEELGVPVWIHTSVNWTTERRMDYGRPIHLDRGYVVPVLGKEFYYMNEFLKVDQITDWVQYNRICTLEYLFQHFNAEIPVGAA